MNEELKNWYIITTKLKKKSCVNPFFCQKKTLVTISFHAGLTAILSLFSALCSRRNEIFLTANFIAQQLEMRRKSWTRERRFHRTHFLGRIKILWLFFILWYIFRPVLFRSPAKQKRVIIIPNNVKSYISLLLLCEGIRFRSLFFVYVHLAPINPGPQHTHTHALCALNSHFVHSQ